MLALSPQQHLAVHCVQSAASPCVEPGTACGPVQKASCTCCFLCMRWLRLLMLAAAVALYLFADQVRIHSPAAGARH
jgi:hypothetical protein